MKGLALLELVPPSARCNRLGVAAIRRINPWVAAATLAGLALSAVLAWRLLRHRHASG
jgi:hypothetical protein